MKTLILIALGSLLIVETTHAAFPGRQRLPTVNIVSRDANATEGGGDSGRFVIHRNFWNNRPLRVFYRVGGSAENGVDYETIPNSVVIPAGRASVPIPIQPLDDALVEDRERVVIRLLPSPRQAYRIGALAGARVNIHDNEPQEPASFTLAPTAVGTVVNRSELGEYSVIPEDLQSAYFFHSSADLREFRRAILEFQLPALITRHVVRATLHLTDGSATSPDYPEPETVHQVFYYPGDLQVTTNDFDAPAEYAWSFSTDFRVNEEQIAMDLTQPVRALLGQNLGLRIKLHADPEIFGHSLIAGAEFQTIYQTPPRLVIETTLRPSVTLPQPSDVTLHAPLNVRLSAAVQDQDGYVRHVEFFANGQKVAEQYLNEPETHGTPQNSSVPWNNVPAGTYFITAVATDNQGAQTTSAPVTLLVCPEPSVLIPTYGTVIHYPPDGTLQVFTGDIHAGTTRDDIRQGFIEFAVPAFSASEPLLSATLVMINNSGIPNPIEGQTQAYEVSYYTNYTDADLMVATNDWDNLTIPFAQFAPQLRDAGERITVDITDLVRQFSNTNLGLRVSGVDHAEAKWFKDVAIIITTGCTAVVRGVVH